MNRSVLRISSVPCEKVFPCVYVCKVYHTQDKGRQSNLLEVSFPAISLITYVVQQMKLTCALEAFPIRIRPHPSYTPWPSPSPSDYGRVPRLCVHFAMHLILEITLTILNGPLTHDTPCSLHLSHVPSACSRPAYNLAQTLGLAVNYLIEKQANAGSKLRLRLQLWLRLGPVHCIRLLVSI